MTTLFARIYLVAQKSELCYSPVGTTRTLLCSKPFPAPHTASFRSTRPKMRASINPTLVYMNSLFLQIHQTARASFDMQTVIFILVTSSNKCPQDGIYSVAETTIGSSRRAVFDATPRPLKTTLGLCAVTWLRNASWSAPGDLRRSCSSSQPSTWIKINSRERSLEKHATSILDVISTNA